jgi:hypothetical protein
MINLSFDKIWNIILVVQLSSSFAGTVRSAEHGMLLVSVSDPKTAETEICSCSEFRSIVDGEHILYIGTRRLMIEICEILSLVAQDKRAYTTSTILIP